MAKSTSKTIFVGGLSIAIGERELIEYFSAFSKVLKIVFLRDQETGKSKGYAFVTLKDSNTANQVSQQKHIICGRRVECQLAAHKSEKQQNSMERSMRKLFITNVPQYLTDREFDQFFSQFGPIHNCYIIKNSDKLSNKSFGFVEYEYSKDAEYVLSQKAAIYNGNPKLVVLPFKDMKANQIQDFEIARKAKATGATFKTRKQTLNQAQSRHSGSFHSTTHCYTPQNANAKFDQQFNVHEMPIGISQGHHHGGLDHSESEGSSDSSNLHFHLSSRGLTSASKTTGNKQVCIYNKSLNAYQVQQFSLDNCSAYGSHLNRSFHIHAASMRLSSRPCSDLPHSPSAGLCHLKLFTDSPAHAGHLVDSPTVDVEQSGCRIESFMPCY
jgi:RNA recognition motif-containing protein